MTAADNSEWPSWYYWTWWQPLTGSRYSALKASVRLWIRSCSGGIRSFVCDRSQRVSSDGCLPLLIVIHFGVPQAQGSVLRLFCFCWGVWHSFYQMRQLRSIRWSPSADAMRALVQALVYYRLDYCNSLLTGASDVYLTCLQSAQNAATGLVLKARPRHPGSTTLHWIPVRRGVTFKTAVLAWKCLDGIARLHLRTLRSCCLCFRSSASHASSDRLTASSQSSNHNRSAEFRCRGTVTVEQSSCFSTETGDGAVQYLQVDQATTEELYVLHLVSWRTEVSLTTARRCFCVSCDSGVAYRTPDLLAAWSPLNRLSIRPAMQRWPL